MALSTTFEMLKDADTLHFARGVSEHDMQKGTFQRITRRILYKCSKNGLNLGLVLKDKKVVISPSNNMLWLLIRIASRMRF